MKRFIVPYVLGDSTSIIPYLFDCQAESVKEAIFKCVEYAGYDDRTETQLPIYMDSDEVDGNEDYVLINEDGILIIE